MHLLFLIIFFIMLISDFSSPLRDASDHLFVPEPLVSYLQHLESYCDYACCDMDAFDFSAENTAAWAQAAGIETVRIALLQLRELKQLTARIDFRKITGNYPLDRFQEKNLSILLNAAEANLVAQTESHAAS